MRHAYEREDGLMKLTKIPYDKLEESKNCQVKSCDTCDAYEKEKKSFYSTTKAKGMDTLLKRQGKESIFSHLGKQ